MSLQSKFLTLPIKNQICIAIIVLNLFCILVILSIFGSFAYQILKEDFKQKRLYFYEKYKEYIESCFYLQNFYLLQYEELIKRIQLQMRDILLASTIYKYTYNINMHIMNMIKLFEFNQDYPIDELEQENNDNDYLYYRCFQSDLNCLLNQISIFNQYNELSSLVSSHNINKKFNIPMFDNVAIMGDPVFYEFFSNSIFSFNLSKLLTKFKEIFGDKEDIDLLNSYLEFKFKDILNELNSNIDLFLLNPLPQIELLFNKAINFVKQEMPDYIDISKNRKSSTVIRMSSIFPKMDYGNSQFNLINEYDELLVFFYIESSLIDNYLYFINNKLSSFLELFFIPLYSENNTIISPDLSILFLLKQVEFQITQKEIDELYEKIIKGESKIQDCIKDFEFLKNKLEINDIFNLNQAYFVFVSNSSINQGILNLANSNYYFMKYSYPNLNSLFEFKPEYFYKDQINYYAFNSFKEPLKYVNLLLQISSNCFYLFLLIIVYIWFFCFIINIIIFNKVIKQLIEPIKKIQEALISNSIKDVKIFEYEYDDIINDLFLTCKQFLIGQIDKDNKENGLDHLNSLSIYKDKYAGSEENKYKKNLRINNYIMNKLLNQQKILMDFSKYIEINENNDFQNYEEYNNNNSFLYNKKMNFDNINVNNELNNNIQNKNTFKVQKEEKEKENREFFKKLFQISEYIYYFLKENNKKIIIIKDNEIKDESDKNKKNEKSSQNFSISENTNYNSNTKKTDSNLLNNDNSKVFSINTIGKDDMTYIWYMEAKKRNNKSLNYKIGNNYEELFSDSV